MMMIRLASVAVLMPLLAVATDVFVDNKAGNDSNDGLSAQRAYKTLAKATSVLKAGDVLVMAPDGKYYESLVLKRGGTAAKPIVIRGNGSIVCGMKPIPVDRWEAKGDGLFLNANNRCWGALRPRVFLGETQMVSVVCGHYKHVKPATLTPLQAIWNEEGVWFRAERGRSAADYDLRGTYGHGAHSGVLIEGSDYLVIEDIVSEGFPNDGFNVHGSCHGLVFRDIVGRWNGDDGFSVHEDVQANVYHAHLHHNDFGIQDINASQTLFFGCTVENNRLCGVDVYGGMRVLHDVVVRGNGGGQVHVSRGDADQLGFARENPMLKGLAYLKNVRIEGGEGVGIRVGRQAEVTAVGCLIFGVETGVAVDGRLHLMSSRVEQCRKCSVSKDSQAEFVERNCRIDPGKVR